jgi:DNA-binding transcriptional MerR regulator
VGPDVGGAAALRIGEAATRAGVSTRTLRYYQELGLVAPSGVTQGGARRYSDADVARCLRVRELQHLMGFDLDEIRTILQAEDRISELRAEWFAAQKPARRRAILREAMALNDRQRMQVRDKATRLDAFLDELEAKAARYRELAAELHAQP